MGRYYPFMLGLVSYYKDPYQTTSIQYTMECIRYRCYVAHMAMNNEHIENVYMDVSKNNGTPKSSHFNMVFHYKPLHVGGNTPIFGETSIYCKMS